MMKITAVRIAAPVVAAFFLSVAPQSLVADPASDTLSDSPAAPAPAAAPSAPPATPAATSIETGAVTPPAAETPIVTAPPSNGEAAPTTPENTETPAAAPATEPAATEPAAAPATAPAAAPATEAAVAPTPASPVVEDVRKRLDDKTFVGRWHGDDIAALKAFYATQADPVWTKDGAFTDAAKSIIAELKKADDWGLEASAFNVPDMQSGATADVQGAAEATLALEALKYARYARGGRINPRALSNILDVSGEIKDPAVVLGELKDSTTPDAVLRGLHPKHPEFEALRQALLKARGPAVVEEPEIDPALKIKLPEGKGAITLKAGVEHDDVALLRQRLKAPAENSDGERVFDDALVAAVVAYQEEKGIKADGMVGAGTRRVLNREGEPAETVAPSKQINLILANMERWRWLPADLGTLYIWNNTPEYVGRVMADGAPIFEERIIVGLPNWPTPMMTDSMKKIVFNPEWGMPDGIKVKELLPRLRRASGGGGGFFDELFGGGSSSGGARVLAAYGLKPSYNGRPVDANAIDWNRVDIRRFSFVQPAGASNPLGRVKFMFPNRHDVYMHDTTQRSLFGQSRRALSHGCIRVQSPEKLAEILLSRDKGWSSAEVASRFRSGTNEVMLTKPVPVYLTYFTARIGADGKLKTFGDIYGHDGRLLSALAGKPVRYAPPPSSPEDDVIDDATVSYNDDEPAPQAKKKQRPTQKYATKKKSGESTGDVISDALSGILFN
jgi:murein L,D-transpeptidase YcbB/YkuD